MKKIAMLSVLLASLTVIAQEGGYKVGDKAIDFKLTNVDGRTVSLKDYKDAKGFIVVFTCNHCPYVIKNEERINDLNRKYASKGYPVIAINPTDTVKFPANTFAKMQERARERGFTFPYLVDPTQEIAKTYGATKTPHVYLLQKKGKDYIVQYTGAIDDNTDDPAAVTEKYVENAVDALLAGKPVPKKESKAIGCGIVYRD